VTFEPFSWILTAMLEDRPSDQIFWKRNRKEGYSRNWIIVLEGGLTGILKESMLSGKSIVPDIYSDPFLKTLQRPWRHEESTLKRCLTGD